MEWKRIAPLLVAFALLTPAFASTANAEDVQKETPRHGDFRDVYPEVDTVEEFEALFEAPTDMGPAEAEALLYVLMTGGEVEQTAGFDLMRFLRGAADTDNGHEAGLAARVMSGALLGLITNTMNEMHDQPLVSIPMSNDYWGSDTFDELTVPLTLAYIAATAAAPDAVGISINGVDVYVRAGVIDCNEGVFCAIAVLDDLLTLSLNWHKTTDTLSLQLPLAVKLAVHCIYVFGICFPLDIRISFPKAVIAGEGDYVYGFPAMNGELATRVANNDLLQLVYDALGSVNNLKGQHWTAAEPTRNTPAHGSVPGGLPGVGDLHAAAPQPTYYGVQMDSLVTGAAGTAGPPPAAPATDPMVDERADVKVRSRGDSGWAPLDRVGVTAAYDTAGIKAWELNLAFMRWQNVGIGDVGNGGPPGAIYYDAPTGYIFGGSGNVHTWDFDMNDPATS